MKFVLVLIEGLIYLILLTLKYNLPFDLPLVGVYFLTLLLSYIPAKVYLKMDMKSFLILQLYIFLFIGLGKIFLELMFGYAIGVTFSGF